MNDNSVFLLTLVTLGRIDDEADNVHDYYFD